MKISDAVKFFIRYIRSPRNTGAVCPSSRFLARKMAMSAGVSANELKETNSLIVELGAGTGAVTKALIDVGFAKNLVSVEFDSSLYEILVQKYPSVRILHANAEFLSEALGDDSKRVSAIISSLPLLSLPKECVANIISQIEETLQSGGKYVQYTYKIFGSNKNVCFKNMRLVSSSIVLANIPPARVDVYEKI